MPTAMSGQYLARLRSSSTVEGRRAKATRALHCGRALRRAERMLMTMPRIYSAAGLASLPLTLLLAFIWLYLGAGSAQRVADLSQSILWLALPSLTLFVALPLLLRAAADRGRQAANTCHARDVQMGTTPVSMIKLLLFGFPTRPVPFVVSMLMVGRDCQPILPAGLCRRNCASVPRDFHHGCR